MDDFQGQRSNDRVAFVLLIKSIMDQIDEIAVLLRHGKSASLSRQLLTETCSILEEITPAQLECYFETLLTLADSLGTSTIRSVNESYAESVADAKRRFVHSIRDRLKVAI